jgi:hypothetical protein
VETSIFRVLRPGRFIWHKFYVLPKIRDKELNVATFSKYKQPPFITTSSALTLKF